MARFSFSSGKGLQEGQRRALQAATEILRITGDQWTFDSAEDEPASVSGRYYREIYFEVLKCDGLGIHLFLRKINETLKRRRLLVVSAFAELESNKDHFPRGFFFRWDGEYIDWVIEVELLGLQWPRDIPNWYSGWGNICFHYIGDGSSMSEEVKIIAGYDYPHLSKGGT